MYKAFLRCTTSMTPDPETAKFVFMRKAALSTPSTDETPGEELIETYLPESKSRSMQIMAQIMTIAIETHYGFEAANIIAGTHDYNGGYMIVFCSTNAQDNEEIDPYSDPDFHDAASAFLSDLSGLNTSSGIEIDHDTLCLTVARQIDLFNLLEEYAQQDEHLLPNLDHVSLTVEPRLENVREQFYRESIHLNAAKARDYCADEKTANDLLHTIAPKAYSSRTHYEAELVNIFIPPIPFSMDHLAKIIEQEEGTRPPFDRPGSLVLGGYQ